MYFAVTVSGFFFFGMHCNIMEVPFPGRRWQPWNSTIQPHTLRSKVPGHHLPPVAFSNPPWPSSYCPLQSYPSNTHPLFLLPVLCVQYIPPASVFWSSKYKSVFSSSSAYDQEIQWEKWIKCKGEIRSLGAPNRERKWTKTCLCGYHRSAPVWERKLMNRLRTKNEYMRTDSFHGTVVTERQQKKS